jgi:hypothetical protein
MRTPQLFHSVGKLLRPEKQQLSIGIPFGEKARY